MQIQESQMSEETAIQKNYEKASSARLVQYMEKHNLNQRQLGEKLGYSHISQWINSGECPKVVDNLIKAWNSLETSKNSSLFVACVPKAQEEHYLAVCKGFGIDTKVVL